MSNHIEESTEAVSDLAADAEQLFLGLDSDLHKLRGEGLSDVDLYDRYHVAVSRFFWRLKQAHKDFLRAVDAIYVLSDYENRSRQEEETA